MAGRLHLALVPGPWPVSVAGPTRPLPLIAQPHRASGAAALAPLRAGAPRGRAARRASPWAAAALALLPTTLGFWKREYGVSYGYGGAVALIAGLVLLGREPLTLLATVHASVHLLYGVRLIIFLLYRETCVPRFRKMRERIEGRAPSSRLARAPFIVSCAFLYLCMSAPVMLTASAPAIEWRPARVAAWAAVLLALAGLLVAAWGDTHKSLAKARLGDEALVTGGIYRYLRHPNYTGELALWSASTLAGAAAALASFTPARAASLAASLVGLLGIGFVLARATTGLEKRQQEAHGADPRYAPWLQGSWAGVTLRARAEAA